ncbi:DUF892 family protein [Flavobacterium sp. NG2]|uniref:YciE/YciF ferroxidase family protein n=1 Tax=Flavobacterium sp. NG2 TaxID=3097547 RepID=UPI002A80B2EF|nr:DUF892 family protein [Flavobacterium sp. NG2]WPR71345.1 DUF892 family protein [Flavobacterium sp. NG2]
METLTKEKETSFQENHSVHGLRDLFEIGLKEMYYSEKALGKILPKMLKNATTPELIETLKNHLAENKKQIARLEVIFKTNFIEVNAQKCEAMNGLLKETIELLKNTDVGTVRDAGIISSEQKMKHYEIATYGTLRAFANILGNKKTANLLAKTLNEDKKADKALSKIAMYSINQHAYNANAITTVFM